MIPSWYFDESRMAGVDFQNTAQVEAYDRKQTSSTPEKEQALVSRLGIKSGHTVIDLGTGTGTFAIQAAQAGAIVYAVDISQAMLDYARTKAEQVGVKQIHFHQAGFLSYDHPGERADFVVVKNALHIEGVFKANDNRWERFSFQIDQYLDAGDSIVVIGAYEGRHRQSQKALRAVAAHIYDLVDGKVWRFRMFADTKTIWDSMAE